MMEPLKMWWGAQKLPRTSLYQSLITNLHIGNLPMYVDYLKKKLLSLLERTKKCAVKDGLIN